MEAQKRKKNVGTTFLHFEFLPTQSPTNQDSQIS